jgi:hypothetical protein
MVLKDIIRYYDWASKYNKTNITTTAQQQQQQQERQKLLGMNVKKTEDL